MRRECEMKVPVALTFKRESLLYDIGNIAYVEGDVADVKDERQRHPIIDINEDGNVDRVTRVLDMAHAEAVEMLYPYAKKAVCEGVIGNELTETDEYSIPMLVPRSFSQTTLLLVAKLVNEYMVCRVLEDWLKVTDKAAAKEWTEKKETAEAAIASSINARRGRVRRTLAPF